MARHYTTRDFFRQMPNRLLARYFHARGLFEDFDFGSLPDTRPDALFAAWLDLPESQRHAMDVEFRDIAELSCDKGWRAIIDEAAWHLRDPAEHATFVERLAALPNHVERATTTFLDHPTFWKGAALFFHADSLPYWRKRTHLPHVPAAVDKASLSDLASNISTFFHRTEGRGKNCVVEPFRRSALDYFFAYPEDYSQQSVEWVNGEFARRPHNPAFEVIYVYSQQDGSLDLNFRGSRKAVEPLQAMFATTILKLPELPPDPKDERVYDLNRLRQPGFEFVYESGRGIQDVVVKKLRLSSRIKKGDRITLEADATGNPKALYELLAQLGTAVPLHLYHITQVELSASMITEANKPPKKVSIRITHPNSCSLKYDERDLVLRDMLHASGIEPKAPAERTDADAVPEAEDDTA